jgi:hypothetical protein
MYPIFACLVDGAVFDTPGSGACHRGHVDSIERLTWWMKRE